MRQQKQSIRLQLTGQPATRPGRFQVLFITEGQANGWTFSKQVLQDSAELWDGASVFVDHALWGRSVRDLGGVLSNTAWSEEFSGLVADLTPAGPSREIIIEAAQFMLSESSTPDVGFSADLIFTADAQLNVQKILQPISVDFVINPAFATKFIRQLNQKGISMKKTKPDPPDTDDDDAEDDDKLEVQQSSNVIRQSSSPSAIQLAEAQKAVRELEQFQSQIAQETGQAKRNRIELGNQLIEASLSASELPASAQKAITSRFKDKPFNPSDLREEIKNWKDTIAEATAGNDIIGPARISGMFDTADQLQAAVDDLLTAPREKGAENLKVPRFTGVKEAYVQMTGDRDFVGGYFKDRVLFQHTTANFPGLVANALNKALIREWGKLGAAGYDWWQRICTVEHFDSLNDISWLIFGTAQSLPTVPEGAEYPEIKLGDGKETSSFVKKGGYIGITLEALDRDNTRKLRQIPRELANAALREISGLVAAIFTANAGVGPTMADTGALFNSTAVTTAGGHKNLLTTAIGTDFVAWDAIAAAMYNQPMLVSNDAGYIGTGKPMGINPKYCLVPRALQAAAEALFIPRWATTNAAMVIAAKGGPTYGGYVEPITVPDWTDVTDYAAVADPAIAPAIMVGERFGLTPQIFVAGSESDPAMFANDESRIKVRHFVAVGVADFRPLHKENVAG